MLEQLDVSFLCEVKLWLPYKYCIIDTSLLSRDTASLCLINHHVRHDIIHFNIINDNLPTGS